MKPQQKVAEATARRGYLDGWSDVQLLARQCAKLQEELAELADSIDLSGNYRDRYLQNLIRDAGSAARVQFDAPRDRWGSSIPPLRMDRIRQELADCQVVLFNAAYALERLTGQPFDIVEAAVEKATADIERGIRNGAKE